MFRDTNHGISRINNYIFVTTKNQVHVTFKNVCMKRTLVVCLLLLFCSAACMAQGYLGRWNVTSFTETTFAPDGVKLKGAVAKVTPDYWIEINNDKYIAHRHNKVNTYTAKASPDSLILHKPGDPSFGDILITNIRIVGNEFQFTATSYNSKNEKTVIVYQCVRRNG